MPTKSSSPRRRRVRIALAAALIAAGCSGGGGGCGSSCGGAFKTVDDQGRPFPTPGDRLDNVAQVRLTKSGFDFLNAAHLNEVLASLNGESAIRQTFTAPAGINAAVFWYRAVCPGNVAHGWATATLQDNTASTVTTVLPRTCSNTGSWTQVTAPLTEKHSYTLTLANHDADDAAGPTFTFYDDVSVTGPSNPIKNGTFEVGSLAGWGSAGTAEIDRLPHSGGYAAQVGSSSLGVSIPCIDAGTLFQSLQPVQHHPRTPNSRRRELQRRVRPGRQDAAPHHLQGRELDARPDPQRAESAPRHAPQDRRHLPAHRRGA